MRSFIGGANRPTRRSRSDRCVILTSDPERTVNYALDYDPEDLQSRGVEVDEEMKLDEYATREHYMEVGCVLRLSTHCSSYTLTDPVL